MESPAPRRSLLAGRGRFWAAVVACLVLAALLRPWPAQFKFRYGGDAVRYLNWSRAVAHKGLAAFPELVVEYRARWVGFPPPTRWSYLMAIAGLMRAWPTASDEYHPGVLLSWLASVLALLPLALWLRRMAPPEVTLLALALTATAPVERALAHFPVPDSLQLLLALALLALVAERLAAPRRWHLPAIALAALLVVTSREAGAIALFGGAALVVVDRRSSGRLAHAPLYAMLAGCVVALAITIPLAGGPRQLALLTYDVVHGALFTTGSAPYVGGPYYRYLVDFMIVSPVLTVAALTSIGPLWRRPEWRRLVEPVAVASLVMLALYSLLPKTLRYVMVVDVGMRVLCAAAVGAMWKSGRRDARVAAAALVALLVGGDLFVWARLWSADQIYDPVTWGMAKYLGMIP